MYCNSIVSLLYLEYRIVTIRTLSTQLIISIPRTQRIVGPGLAQLVERLAHRYSESTSSNPSNLTSATVCGDRDWLCAGCQEVSKCSTRGGSWGMYIMFASAMQIRQPTLALKPRGDVTGNQKQGYQWPQKWTCVHQKI